MRTRKPTRQPALPALDSSRAGGTAAPHGRGARGTAGAVGGTRPSARATQLSLRLVEDVGREHAATPRLDSVRAAKLSVVRGADASSSVSRRLGELRAALQDGWEIVQPIFARPLWSAADDSATAFNFVLRGPSGTRLITVPEGRTVERFIRDRHLNVDYAR